MEAIHTPVPIVFATDHNYVMPTGVAIHSLLQFKEAYDIYVITGPDVTLHDKEMLKKEVKCNSDKCEIKFLEADDTFKNAYTSRHISVLTYSRFLIPELLPQYDKVIYCDQDIIFKTPLAQIYNETDLEASYVAGVKRRYKDDSIYFKEVVKAGLDPDNYINAGFLILNTGMMRRHDLLPEFIRLSPNRYYLMDQDILNIVCRNKIKYLPERFNVTPEQMTKEMLGQQCIIHYSGDKPWNTFKKCWFEWWENYRESVFYDPEFYLSLSNDIRKAIKRGNEASGYLQYPEVKKLLKIRGKIQPTLQRVPFIKNLLRKLFFPQ